MKPQVSLFVCALFLFVTTARAQTPDREIGWNTYTIKGEHLSVALPSLPALQTFKDTRTFSDKQRKRNLLRCSAKGIVYSVQTIENTKPLLTLEDFVRQQTRAYSSDTLTFDRDLTIDGIAGKAFLYRDRKGMVQFFANDKRLYEIRAYGASADDSRIAQFFQTLSFKKQAGAYEISGAVESDGGDIVTTEPIIPAKDLDTKVRLISKPEPTYTDAARSKWITGTVVLKALLTGDGTVSMIQVVQGLPEGLTERAIAVARQIKFIPATKNGKNVSMWLQLEYNFNLTR